MEMWGLCLILTLDICQHECFISSEPHIDPILNCDRFWTEETEDEFWTVAVAIKAKTMITLTLS